MNIESQYSGGVLTVRICGEIDHHSAHEARRELDGMIIERNPRELCLDLSGVDFMDSSGLGLVLGRFRKQSELGGVMKIVNPNRRVFQILQLAGADKIIRIENKRPESRNGEVL